MLSEPVRYYVLYCRQYDRRAFPHGKLEASLFLAKAVKISTRDLLHRELGVIGVVPAAEAVNSLLIIHKPRSGHSLCKRSVIGSNHIKISRHKCPVRMDSGCSSTDQDGDRTRRGFIRGEGVG